jgi:putative DNA primase/helicase
VTETPNRSPTPLLFDHHARELLVDSAIDPEVVRERGYRSISRPGANDERPREEMARLGIPTWATRENWNYPALLAPMFRGTGELAGYQFKPASPVTDREGKKRKYAAVKGCASVIDVHPRWSRDRGADDPALLPVIRDIGTTLYITEGIKKADAWTSRGFCTVALAGVWNWRSTLGSLGDWEDIPLKGRTVVVLFDADAVQNAAVLMAMKRFGKWLKSKGASVRYLIPPATFNGAETKGVDDYLAAGGTPEELLERIRSTPPEAVTGGADPFTDAALAEEVAGQALEGRFCHTTSMGWLRWNGHRWAQVDDNDVVEVVRQHVRGEYIDAVERKLAAVKRDDAKAAAGAEFDEQGWHKYQAKAKLEALVKLASGIETTKRDAAEFDRDPDVLNMPGGLLHLDTLHVEPHHPDQMVTKVTAVDYVPGYTHPAWKTALLAVPEDAVFYLQCRLGQSLTGYPPDDDEACLLTGEGNNGKTIVMSGVVNALGNVVEETGYAAMIASELLLTGSSKGAATPEKMDLRGARLAYMEETPEDRYLSVNTLKQIVGTPTIKGRFLYKNQLTFRSTHSLFLNTNFPPKVIETDEASWRRLTRLDFPWRFRAVNGTGRALDTKGEWLATDRPADPGLKEAVGAQGPGEADVLRAALAWLVEGAHLWYQKGRSLKTLPRPKSVVASVAEWRNESDYIHAFVKAELAADRASWITSEELYEAFSDFMDGQSRRGKEITPSQSVFMDRLKRHTGLGFKVADVRKRIGDAGQSRRRALLPDSDHGKQRRAVSGVRFLTRDDWLQNAA